MDVMAAAEPPPCRIKLNWPAPQELGDFPDIHDWDDTSRGQGTHPDLLN